MARPLKIKYNGTAFEGLQEMSNTDLDTLADLILSEQTNNPTEVGHLSVNGLDNTWTHIGTFSDTRRDQAVGTHPANTTIHTEDYVFRQNLTAITPSTVRPHVIKYDGSSNFQGLEEMTDAYIVDNIIERVKIKIGVFGIGTYKLQPTAPTGGTWTSVDTITNKTVTGNNTSTLWRRIDNTSLTANRPIKWNSTGLQEMSDTELKKLVEYLRSEIIASGVGRYILSTSAPTTGGTWIQAGTGFTDDRHQRTNQNYSGSYTGGYTGGYTRYYSGRNAGTYYGTYYGTYIGTYVGATIMSTKETVETLKLWLRIS